MFQLKDYQQRCKDELAQYLRRVIVHGRADLAFYEQTGRAYRPVHALPGLPYVCVRVPTGGGKTVLAAHSVGIAAKELLHQDRCMALWLAPTKQIVEQTLKALRDKRHPYRQALDDAFGGCVSVMDLAAALGLGRSVLESDTVVIVSTLAAMRVENTDGRKIYEANGQLMACFDGVTKEQLAAATAANGFDPTEKSLANLLRLHRPLVIVDEAHNARTHLSFDTLARFNPSCILEFTATPDQDPKGDPSNVLTHVSAVDLKAADMIKLPIRLKAREQWKEAVQEAIAKRDELERLALEEEKATGEYVRPIILFQAQRNEEGRENITYDVLKKSLMADFNIPEEQIAISTGTVNDLENLPVLERGQPVRFIITVDKLREGWDCPFAYILCTISNLSASTAVEQILGRVLRLPYARKKQHDDLNHAYAFCTSQRFHDSAMSLAEALVESGFEKFEAQAMIKPDRRSLDFPGPLWGERVSEPVSTAPAVEALPGDLQAKLTVRTEGAAAELVYEGPPMSEAEAGALKAVFQKKEDKEAVERLCRKSHGEDTSPAAMGKVLSVPVLAIREGEQLEFFEDQFLDTAWSLGEFDPVLSEAEFKIDAGPRQMAIVDAREDGKIVADFVPELQRELALLDAHGPKTETELAVWLDRAIEHRDVTHAEGGLFMRRMVKGLIEQRGLALEQLVAHRFRLRDAAREKLTACRKAANLQAFQRMLLPDAANPVEVSPDKCFTFPGKIYPASRLYAGPVGFRKHYYANVGHMNDEEAECASLIASLDEVEYWVRNLERDRFSFWLPTPTDKFYPDFVAFLKDGRYLVVEYKGGHLMSADDATEKKDIGDLWQARSGGACLFRLVGKANMGQAIAAAVQATAR